MNSKIEDVVKQIPDFEEFLELAKKIREVSLEKLLIEKELKERESKIYRDAVTDPKYLIGGKTPAISFIKSAYEFTGPEGELVKARERLAEVTAELDYLKMTMGVYKDMLSIFQTLSANERGVSL